MSAILSSKFMLCLDPMHFAEALRRDGSLNLLLALFCAAAFFRLCYSIKRSFQVAPAFTAWMLVSAFSNLLYLHGNLHFWDSRQLILTSFEVAASLECLRRFLWPSRTALERYYAFCSYCCYGFIPVLVFTMTRPVYENYPTSTYILQTGGWMFCYLALLSASMDVKRWGSITAWRNHAFLLMLWFGGNFFSNMWVAYDGRQVWFTANAFKLLLHAICIVWWPTVLVRIPVVAYHLGAKSLSPRSSVSSSHSCLPE